MSESTIERVDDRLAIEREGLRIQRAMLLILARQYEETVRRNRRDSRSLWERAEDALFDW